jgi:hypothetical protein
MAEGELRAAAAGVEDHERAAIQPEPGAGGDEGQPGLLVAGDDLDGHTALRAHGVDDLRAVGCDAQARGADGGDRAHAMAAGLVGHVGDGRDGAVARAVEIAPPSARPSPRRVISARSTSVRQPPSAVASATMNLIELVPASITA